MLSKRQKGYLVIKREVDIFGSLLGLILLSPLLVICAIITEITSPGPLFYRQERIGRNQKTFRIFKFRSMRVDVPEIPPSEMTKEQQEAMTYGWGEFMRNTSLDEIPQLINILLGDMSFIGPRPGAAHDEEELRIERESRIPSAFEVRPGLSGYAQIHMKRNHDPVMKATFDSYYVQHMSAWFDLKIFLYSFLVLFGFTKGR